ncbi:uncharacterized protein LOC144166578 [Haemaphysalis longicornis]|uniref:Clathrin light chain n=1 Tax=Haemaphysalis longicornis TaxID=44386 RepID=A0A9J6GD08_HAELO|nr:hypothetical protein HPB48_009145 [Haemaphysalis longicornis]
MDPMDEFTPFETHLDAKQQQQQLSPHSPVKKQQEVSPVDDLFSTPPDSRQVGNDSLIGDDVSEVSISKKLLPDDGPINFSLDDFLAPEAPAKPPAAPREEPEKIRKWREEMKKYLEEKDAQEEIKKQELRENAQRELAEWYARYNESVAKRRAANRSGALADWSAGRVEVADRTAPDWENIARLCDFNNAKASRNAKDTSRIRSIVLQLKQNPPSGSRSVPSPAISN